MSDIRQWNRDFLIEFIELYRSFPCVWKVKSAEYRDRTKKNKAYEALMIKCKEVDRSATVKTVKQKIDSLRGAFRKELKKVKDSSKSGSEDIYKPHLWYFNELLFLTDHEMTRTRVGNIKEEDDDEDANDAVDLRHSEDEAESSPAEISLEERTDTIVYTRPHRTLSRHSNRSISSSSRDVTSPTYRSKRSKADAFLEYHDILRRVDQHLDRSVQVEDQFDIIGKNIAYKLRSLPTEIAVVTEKLIMDIIFESQIGNVDKYSKI